MAPDHAPATLSGITLTGTPELHFAPYESHYLVRLHPNVTETTISYETTEDGATSEIFAVRVDGKKMVLESADADPNTLGYQARLSPADADSLVLVRVTSADGMRQDMYGVMLEKPDSIQRDDGRSDRTTRHSGACSRIDDLIISYGDQTVDISDSCRDTLTLPSEVRQITVTDTAVDGGKARVVPPDADTNQPGHQVNLRPSRPGAGPAMSVFTVVVSHTAGRYTSINYYSVFISVSPPTETDATLEALEVLGAEMSPSFVYDLLDYTASVDHDIATATIRVMPNQPDATVSYEPLDADDTTDDYQRPLAAGDNPVTITVTAPNASTTQDYNLTINRAESPSTDATLKDLVVPDVTLSPEFQTAVKTYSATVNSRVTVSLWSRRPTTARPSRPTRPTPTPMLRGSRSHSMWGPTP